jgi:hypothetical protein
MGFWSQHTVPSSIMLRLRPRPPIWGPENRFFFKMKGLDFFFFGGWVWTKGPEILSSWSIQISDGYNSAKLTAM